MSYPSRISSKGQVTIPKKVRSKLKIAPGDFILFEEKEGEVVLKKARLSLEEDFNKLVAVLDKKVKKIGITDKDIEDAIRWARQK